MTLTPFISAARQEIQNALTSGKEVSVHQEPINAFGWTGSAYVVIDPDTGAGAYKISGGNNGAKVTGYFSKFFGVFALMDDLRKNAIFQGRMGEVGAMFGLIGGILDSLANCMESGVIPLATMIALTAVVAIFMAKFSAAAMATVATTGGILTVAVLSELLGFLTGLVLTAFRGIICGR